MNGVEKNSEVALSPIMETCGGCRYSRRIDDVLVIKGLMTMGHSSDIEQVPPEFIGGG